MLQAKLNDQLLLFFYVSHFPFNVCILCIMALIFIVQLVRWLQNEDWETCGPSSEFGWKQIAEPVMKLYTDATDGSSIEAKESALVWQYRDADLSFGSAQAKEMLDHLESVLANEPVAVKSGRFIVEVKLQVCGNIYLILAMIICFLNYNNVWTIISQSRGSRKHRAVHDVLEFQGGQFRNRAASIYFEANSNLWPIVCGFY